MEITSMIAMKALTTTLFASILSSFSKTIFLDKDIIEELMRDIRELKVETNALKKNIILGTLQLTNKSKGFVMMYI